MTLNIDDEIEDLLNQGSTADDLTAKQHQREADRLDGIIEAIKAASTVAALVSPDTKFSVLRNLIKPVRDLKPTDGSPSENQDKYALAIKKITETLKATGWSEDHTAEFLIDCEALPPPPTFQPYTFDELEAMPPKEWIIDSLIGRGDIGMFYGPPGCGKTFTVADLIICGIMGKQWARRFDIPVPLNAAYCAGEGVSGLPARFVAAATHHGATRADKQNFTFFKTVPQFFTGDDIPEAIAIQRFVEEWQKRISEGTAKALDILFVDTLNTATVAAEENSAKDMGKVLSMCRWATQELGCAVVLVHHTNKTGSAERGSSALRGAMDCMIEIKRVSEGGTKAIMSCEKLKDGEAWKPQTLDLVPVQNVDSVRVWWDEPSETTQAKGKEDAYKKIMIGFMQSQPGKKFTAKILAEVAGIGQNNAIRILSKAVEAGLCVSELMDTTKPNSNRNPLAYFANLP
jgi:RecA-family ATPase